MLDADGRVPLTFLPSLSMKAFFRTKHDYGMFLLRISAGAAMLPFGLLKVQTFGQTMGFLSGAGIPAFIAILVIIGESVGAISLILGFCTRFCAGSLAVIMAGAVIFMFDKGYMMGYATPLLFLLMFLPLVLNGAGALSMDSMIARKVS